MGRRHYLSPRWIHVLCSEILNPSEVPRGSGNERGLDETERPDSLAHQ